MTFDEMWEELKSESPEARRFYDECERLAEEMNRKEVMPLSPDSD